MEKGKCVDHGGIRISKKNKKKSRTKKTDRKEKNTGKETEINTAETDTPQKQK